MSQILKHALPPFSRVNIEMSSSPALYLMRLFNWHWNAPLGPHQHRSLPEKYPANTEKARPTPKAKEFSEDLVLQLMPSL